MPPRRGPPIVPSDHMSVGRNHRQYQGSSGLFAAAGHESDLPVVGFPNHTRQVRTRPQRSGNRQVLPQESQYSPKEGEDEDENEEHVESDEENIPKGCRKPRHLARKRQGKAAHQSAYAKKMEQVPGGAGFKRKRRGQVQVPLNPLEQGRSDALEYLVDEKNQRWIPAVYHYKIRSKLINRAKTSEADVYRHPRARGEAMSDVTAFLESQKDWDLERDNGWIGIEQLFKFDVPRNDGPSHNVSWLFDEGRVVLDLDNDPIKDYKDIPLTLSSEVEGALMEAISRLNDEITIYDFWARLPKHCKHGEILKPEALSRRMGRFRLENAVTARAIRKGSVNLRQFLWNRMSPAARAANSTRELNKLSEEEQAQARKANAGKHSANAGGWAKAKNQAEEKVSAQTSAEGEGATTPAVLEPRKRRKTRRTPVSNTNGNEELWCPFDNSEAGRQSRPIIPTAAPYPSTVYTAENPYSMAIYEDNWLDPFLYSQIAHHDHGRPSSVVPNPWSILTTEVASSDETQLQVSPYGQNPTAEFSSVGRYEGEVANLWQNSQYMRLAAQGQITHPPLGVERAWEDRFDVFGPEHIDPRLLLGVPYQDFHRSLGVEDLPENSSGPISPQDRFLEEDVEEFLFGPGPSTSAHQSYPTENQSLGAMDYREIRPQRRE